MTKQDFLQALTTRLSGVPEKELNEALAYYEEMIDDRIEEGMNEADAVAAVGTPDAAADQILSNISMRKLVRERVKPKRRLATWEIVLLLVGSPIWASLAIAALAVFFSLYVVLWALDVVAWAVGASFAICVPVGLISSVAFLSYGNVAAALFFFGSAIALAGLSIFAYFGALAATRGTLRLSKMIWQATKRVLVRKEKTA